MSRKRHQLQQDDSELDMTPMLDVVFIMLIFFIVSASFVKTAGIEVNSPELSQASPQDNASIFIAINAQGEVWLDKREIDIRTVRAIIARMHAEKPEASVLVQADKKATTDALMQVLDQVKAAGISNVAVASKGP